MDSIAMLPHSLDGTVTHYDGTSRSVRVLGISESDEGGYWLVIETDGSPQWIEFGNVTFTEQIAAQGESATDYTMRKLAEG